MMASAQAVQVRTTARTLIWSLGFALVITLTAASNAQTGEEILGTEVGAGLSAVDPAGEPAQPIGASQTEPPKEETGIRAALDSDALAVEDVSAQEVAKFAAAIAKGTVLQQMTVEQVIQARGEPNRKEVIPPDAELWHYPSGEVAFSAGKVTYVSLKDLDGREQYKVEVINRPGEYSGVWRTRVDDPSYRRYYLIVEAVGENGQPSSVEILDHETGLTQRVLKWGIEVSQEVYERFVADKLDDGVIESRRVGSVTKTAIRPKYTIPTSGLAITDW